MSSCPIQSAERLRALLVNELPEDQAAGLRAHLDQECPRCLELFAELEGEEILGLGAGPAARLSPDEAEAMFAAANPEPRKGFWSSLFARPQFLVAASMAALLLFVLGIAFLPGEKNSGQTHIKSAGGPSPIQAHLMGIVGQMRRGQALAVQRALPDEPLRPGQVLLLRYRIDRPARVLLLAGTGGALEVIHREADPMPAGEHEVQAGGQALAIPAERLGAGTKIVLLACPANAPEPQAPWTDEQTRSCARDSRTYRAGANPP